MKYDNYHSSYVARQESPKEKKMEKEGKCATNQHHKYWNYCYQLKGLYIKLEKKLQIPKLMFWAKMTVYQIRKKISKYMQPCYALGVNAKKYHKISYYNDHSSTSAWKITLKDKSDK